LRTSIARIAHPHLHIQRRWQTLKPKRAAERLQAHQNRTLQPGIKLPYLLRRQPVFRVLSRLHIDHGNLLETRIEITTYNLHGRCFPPSLWFYANSSLLGTGWEPSLL
jgi:hypothetical protein